MLSEPRELPVWGEAGPGHSSPPSLPEPGAAQGEAERSVSWRKGAWPCMRGAAQGREQRRSVSETPHPSPLFLNNQAGLKEWKPPRPPHRSGGPWTGPQQSRPTLSWPALRPLPSPCPCPRFLLLSPLSSHVAFPGRAATWQLPSGFLSRTHGRGTMMGPYGLLCWPGDGRPAWGPGEPWSNQLWPGRRGPQHHSPSLEAATDLLGACLLSNCAVGYGGIP